VDPSGRLGPLLRFSGRLTSGLVVQQEPTWVYWLSSSSSTVGTSSSAGAYTNIGAGTSVDLNPNVLLVCIGSLAPT